MVHVTNGFRPAVPLAIFKFLVLALILTLAACAGTAPFARGGEKRIALTFDDAPLPDGPLFTGAERSQRILAGLKQARAPQAAFFVTTGNIKSAADKDRVLAYASAGHLIANHSHTHSWLSQTSAAEYIADIDRAEQELRSYSNRRPWFRFPYLNESPDVAKRDAVRAALAERRLANGYVTVDTWDWAIVDLMRKAVDARRPMDMSALKDLYLEVMLNAVSTYEGLAVQTLGRSPAHVLLAHENDLQALFIGDLIAALRSRGWTIISPDEAYRDPVAENLPDTLHNGNGRVGALAAVAGINPNRIRDPYHDEALLARMFEQRVLGPPAQQP